MIHIFLDTCCLNIKKRNKTLNRLEQLSNRKNSEFKLTTSTALEKEQKNNKNIDYRLTYITRINEEEKKPEVFRFPAKFGHIIFGDEKIKKKLDIIFLDKDRNDKWLLHTALVNKCDYFLTLNTNDFIKNGRKEAIEKLGIKVREPNDEFLNELNTSLY